MTRIVARHVVFFLMVFLLSDAALFAQSDTTLKRIAVSFDSTISNSPLIVNGILKNIDAIKGLRVVVSQNANGTNAITNDTIFINGGYGAYSTTWLKTVQPCRGIRIYCTKPFSSAVSGLLYATLTVLYKNGANGTSTVYTLKH